MSGLNKKLELEQQLEEITKVEKHFEQMGEVPSLEIALSSLRETKKSIKRDIKKHKECGDKNIATLGGIS